MKTRRHDVLDDEARDRAALAALAVLPPDKAAAYAEHLLACDVCRAEFEDLKRALTALTEIAPEREPPESLWRRLQARISESTPPKPPQPPQGGRTDALETQTWKRWSSDVGDASPAAGGAKSARAATRPFQFVPSDAGDWERTGVPGIEARKLFVDAGHDRVTMLVRMAAGTAYPAHIHAGAEECFVLQGDLNTGDVHLHEGDYQRADVGSVHPVQATDGGCVLLLVSSLHDTLLPV